MSMAASAVIGVLATIMAWQMQDILDILLVGFTINAAALFLPSIAMMYFKRVNKPAAFWSITCSLTVVVSWYAGARLSAAPLFDIDPLWPGITVSFLVFGVMSRMRTAEQ